MQLYGARGTDIERTAKRDALADEAEERRFERAAIVLFDFFKLARLELELLECEREK
jgi:hypothetical protein